MEEIYKTLVLNGKETKYSVSTKGNVINTITGEPIGQFLSGIPQYYYVNILEEDGTRKQRRVHRLVAMTHIPKVKGKSFVDHINRNKLDNSVENLRWVTRKENANNKDNTKLYQYEGEYYNLPLTEVLDKFIINEDDKQTFYHYLGSGNSVEECEKLVFKYKRYGLKTATFNYDGVECYIYDLAMVIGISYKLFYSRAMAGWSIDEIIKGVREEKERFPLFTVNGINFYTHKEYREYLGIGEKLYNKLKGEKQMTPEEMFEYTPDEDRMIVIDGILDYLYNHCKRYNTSIAKIKIRRTGGMSIEEALKSPPQRIIKHEINGVVKRNKQWYLHYNLDPKKANDIFSKTKSLKSTLEYYGIDTINLNIEPYTK